MNRHSFWTAGQDSFTLPPAQDQDMFQQLTNVEPVLQGVLQRRRGYTLFSPSLTPAGAAHMYSFRSESTSLRELIYTQPGKVSATDEAGNVVANPLFTPNNSLNPAPRLALSRDFAYFSSPAAADFLKWDGTNGTNNLTNWGIDINNVSTFVGPNLPTGAVSTGPGVAWSGPGNVTACDSVVASTVLPKGQQSQNLIVTGFGFGIGATTNIRGVQVTVNVTLTGLGGSVIGEPLAVSLTLDGTTAASVPLTNSIHIGSTSPTIYGGQTTIWVPGLTATQINSANFGVILKASHSSFISSTRTFNVDCVQITVFEAATPIVVGAPAAGNITLQSGRTYFYAFQNSSTGHTSDLSPASLSTGPLTNQQIPLSGIPVSVDPQVNTVVIMATADGGDQTFLFFLASVPNGTTTYTDNTPDLALLAANVYQETDEFGFLHGIANNKLPPLGNFPTKHKGRLYMASGHILYFSKNLSDVVTSTGLTTGKWEEAWPATNQIDISTRAETISGLLSDGETLWIGTERAIRRLIGDSPQNFQEPEIQFNETGVLNQEVWQVVFYEGQPVGTIWMTPDFRVMASDFNSYQDIGYPVQDILNSLAPSVAQSAHACFVSQGPADYYMLYLPSGLGTTVLVYNLRSKRWFIWQPTDQISASLFNIDGSGNPQWLFSDTLGNIDFWDNTVLQDRNGNNPVNYPVTIQTTWLDMGDYNIRKFVNQIIPTTADQSSLTIAVNGASNELDFNAPLVVVPATTVIPASIPTDVFVPLASGPSHNRAFQFTFFSPPSTIKNVLTGFAIEAGQFHRY